MVRVSTEYQCGTCHKRHCDYNSARRCESGHIVEAAAESLKRDLAGIKARGPKEM